MTGVSNLTHLTPSLRRFVIELEQNFNHSDDERLRGVYVGSTFKEHFWFHSDRSDDRLRNRRSACFGCFTTFHGYVPAAKDGTRKGGGTSTSNDTAIGHRRSSGNQEFKQPVTSRESTSDHEQTEKSFQDKAELSHACSHRWFGALFILRLCLFCRALPSRLVFIASAKRAWRWPGLLRHL